MEAAVRWLGFGAGVGLTALGLGGLVAVGFGLRRPAPVRAVEGATSAAFDGAGRRLSRSRADRLLAYRGAAAATAGLLSLPAMTVTGITLLLLPWGDPTPLAALRAAAAAFFGLGLLPGSAVPAGLAALGAAAGTLFVVFAVAFTSQLRHVLERRADLVEGIVAAAGLPPWGPEILARFGEAGAAGSAALPEFYRRAGRWAAALGSTHRQDLVGEFRPRGRDADAVTALLALLDAAALDVVVRPDADHADARLLIRSGTDALMGIAGRLGMAEPAVRAAMLTADGFADGLARLRESGFVDGACPADAWERFARMRRGYAAAAVGIARRVMSPPAPWSGER